MALYNTINDGKEINNKMTVGMIVQIISSHLLCVKFFQLFTEALKLIALDQYAIIIKINQSTTYITIIKKNKISLCKVIIFSIIKVAGS